MDWLIEGLSILEPKLANPSSKAPAGTTKTSANEKQIRFRAAF